MNKSIEKQTLDVLTALLLQGGLTIERHRIDDRVYIQATLMSEGEPVAAHRYVLNLPDAQITEQEALRIVLLNLSKLESRDPDIE